TRRRLPPAWRSLDANRRGPVAAGRALLRAQRPACRASGASRQRLLHPACAGVLPPPGVRGGARSPYRAARPMAAAAPIAAPSPPAQRRAAASRQGRVRRGDSPAGAAEAAAAPPVYRPAAPGAALRSYRLPCADEAVERRQEARLIGPRGDQPLAKMQRI